MGFFDKFKKKETPVQTVDEGVELGEDALKYVEGGHQNREDWLKSQIDKMQKEIDSGTMEPSAKYQYEVIIQKYKEELEHHIGMIR